MNKLTSVFAVVGAVLLTSLAAQPAAAQATRTWVSGVGDDVNPCSRTAPCKTWAGAISKTAAGGEIDALDPGGFGTLTITKSITIDGGGGPLVSTLNSGGINGFVINDSATGTPGQAKVTIRNVSINGAGTTLGLNGIRFLSGSSLHVENVQIVNQSASGISFAPTAPNSNAELFVSDTNIHETLNGISIAPAPASSNQNANVTLTRVNSTNNTQSGLLVEQGSMVTVRSSTFSGNATGITANSSTFRSRVSIVDSIISSNVNGTSTTGSNLSTIAIANVGILGNTGLSFSITTGGIFSFGNNYIGNNGTDVLPNFPVVPQR